MQITSDWHIHSRNSCDGACMTIADLVAEATQRGITDFGVTDHLHTLLNLPDIVASRSEYLACAPGPRFHFGIEISSISLWELEQIANNPGYQNHVYGIREGGPESAEPAIALTRDQIDEFEIEYVVAGTHWPLYVPFTREAVIRDYHRQNMFLATHSLVDIVAHPWWWMGHWMRDDGRYLNEPWFDDFTVIPRSMHEEFADACVANDTAVEINIFAVILNGLYPASFRHQYVEYLAILKERGVTFSIGSDCHSEHLDADYEQAAEVIAPLGLRDEDFWRLPPRGVA
jgi:histidinol phosphatase-like PHP family hydrolase